MTATRWLAVVLWLATGLGGAAVTWAASTSLDGERAPPATTSPLAADPAVRPHPAESLASVVVARDAFRFGRRPSATPYDPARGTAPTAPGPPKPVLALVGLVLGRDPTAVIEGFPGADRPRIVRAGDVVAGLRIVGIGADQVRVAGMDTTWVLRVREPWR